jgi:hypothetical protein
MDSYESSDNFLLLIVIKLITKRTPLKMGTNGIIITEDLPILEQGPSQYQYIGLGNLHLCR